MSKDADDIYQDWDNFDQAFRLEEMVCLRDQSECKPELLNSAEKVELDERIKGVEGATIITQQLLERTARECEKLEKKVEGSIHETSIQTSCGSLHMLATLGSEAGQALQRGLNGTAKTLLQECYKNGVGFDEVSDIYKKISLIQQFSKDPTNIFVGAAQRACLQDFDNEQIDDYLVSSAEDFSNLSGDDDASQLGH